MQYNYIFSLKTSFFLSPAAAVKLSMLDNLKKQHFFASLSTEFGVNCFSRIWFIRMLWGRVPIEIATMFCLKRWCSIFANKAAPKCTRTLSYAQLLRCMLYAKANHKMMVKLTLGRTHVWIQETLLYWAVRIIRRKHVQLIYRIPLIYVGVTFHEKLRYPRFKHKRG